MIYLASPYTHRCPLIRQYRYDAAVRETARLMASGEHVISPIVHCHPLLDVEELPTTWEYWRSYDLQLFSACSELRVLCLDDWGASEGVQAEIAEAHRRGMTVRYSYGS